MHPHKLIRRRCVLPIDKRKLFDPTTQIVSKQVKITLTNTTLFISLRQLPMTAHSSPFVYFNSYTGAPVVGTPIVGTHYIVSCDAKVCGAERESSRTIQGRMH